MANDLDLVTIKALERQPADMPSLRAFRRALEITMALSEDELRFARARLTGLHESRYAADLTANCAQV